MIPMTNKSMMDQMAAVHKIKRENTKMQNEERRKDNFHKVDMQAAMTGAKIDAQGKMLGLQHKDEKHKAEISAKFGNPYLTKKGLPNRRTVNMPEDHEPSGFGQGTHFVGGYAQGVQKVRIPAGVMNWGFEEGTDIVPVGAPNQLDHVPNPDGTFPYHTDASHYGHGTYYVGYAQGQMPVPTNPEAGPSDTVPAMLTPGEAVIPKEAAQHPKYKKQIKQMINHGRQMQDKRGYSEGVYSVPGFEEGTESVDYVPPDGGAMLPDGSFTGSGSEMPDTTPVVDGMDVPETKPYVAKEDIPQPQEAEPPKDWLNHIVKVESALEQHGEDPAHREALLKAAVQDSHNMLGENFNKDDIGRMLMMATVGRAMGVPLVNAVSYAYKTVSGQAAKRADQEFQRKTQILRDEEYDKRQDKRIAAERERVEMMAKAKTEADRPKAINRFARDIMAKYDVSPAESRRIANAEFQFDEKGTYPEGYDPKVLRRMDEAKIEAAAKKQRDTAADAITRQEQTARLQHARDAYKIAFENSGSQAEAERAYARALSMGAPTAAGQQPATPSAAPVSAGVDTPRGKVVDVDSGNVSFSIGGQDNTVRTYTVQSPGKLGSKTRMVVYNGQHVPYDQFEASVAKSGGRMNLSDKDTEAKQSETIQNWTKSQATGLDKISSGIRVPDPNNAKQTRPALTLTGQEIADQAAAKFISIGYKMHDARDSLNAANTLNLATRMAAEDAKAGKTVLNIDPYIEKATMKMTTGISPNDSLLMLDKGRKPMETEGLASFTSTIQSAAANKIKSSNGDPRDKAEVNRASESMIRHLRSQWESNPSLQKQYPESSTKSGFVRYVEAEIERQQKKK